jgi:surfeit locus 1 family protein
VPAGIEFRFSMWPALATVAGIAVACSLGTWQLGRAAEKKELRTRWDTMGREAIIRVPATALNAADVELRHVEARGVFEPRYGVLLDNRTLKGAAGYQIIMPLRIGDDGTYVLVNRGWIRSTGDRSRLPEVLTPRGEVTVTGTAMVPGRRILELSGSVIEGTVWQNLTIDRYRSVMPIPIQPFVIRQESALNDNLQRVWDPPDFGIDKHYGYAVQWFLLAVTLFIFYIATHVRRTSAQE